MKEKRITGQIVCQPVVMTGVDRSLVLIAIKSNEEYKELHYTHHASCLHKSLS